MAKGQTILTSRGLVVRIPGLVREARRVAPRQNSNADIKTTMNTYGSAFEKTKRRANSRVADLVLPPAIKRQLKDRAKEVSLKNLRPQTAAIQ